MKINDGLTLNMNPSTGPYRYLAPGGDVCQKCKQVAMLSRVTDLTNDFYFNNIKTL